MNWKEIFELFNDFIEKIWYLSVKRKIIIGYCLEVIKKIVCCYNY